MRVLSATNIHRREASSARIAFVTASVLFLHNLRCSVAENVTNVSGGTSVKSAPTKPAVMGSRNEDSLLQALRDLMASDFISIPPSLTRKLLGAELRPECSLALLRTVTALKKLEPWALRLFDATGKYPTGLLQFSRADIGAFDECLETQVRDAYGNVVSQGQYCNLLVHLKTDSIEEKEVEFLASVLHPKVFEFMGLFRGTEVPLLRIGLCFLDDCSEADLQALVDAVLPSREVEVANCVTSAAMPWSTAQIGIVSFLTVLVIVVVWATALDLYMDLKIASQKSGVLLRVLTAFSAARNTRALFHVADKNNTKQYSLSFLHGIRAISVGYIVFGHCYQVISDTWGRFLNILISTEQWGCMIIVWAFDSVDTFFFLSGFLLCLTLTKQRSSGPLVFVIAVVRRLIRTCVPLFFVIMCIYVLPLFVTGPDIKGCFKKLHEEISETWWTLLLQIRNFLGMDERGKPIEDDAYKRVFLFQTLLVHLWYLSTDFQLFVTSLFILLVLKNRKTFMLGTFTVLSLLGCAIALWTADNPHVLPFMTYPAHTRSELLATTNLYYLRPFCHAIAFFSGCMTLLLLDNFKSRKISKGMLLACWCVAVTCVLCVIFMKYPWYSRWHPSSEALKLVAAFFERVMWSLFLSWITFACATGRGGFVNGFLSSSFFAPLSRLSFCVYLIHYPFLVVMLHASRERMHLSHFNQVTLFFGVFIWSCLLAYMAHLVCEAPVAALDKLVFQGLNGQDKTMEQETRLNANDPVLNIGGSQGHPTSVRL